MNKSNKDLILRFLIGFMIFALLVSVKTIIMDNLNSLGFTYFESNSIKETWETFSLEYIFIIVTLIISIVVSLKFNMKV